MALVRNHPNFSKFRMKIGFMMDFSGSSWVYQEEPRGLKDGRNRSFSIEKRPIENTEEVFKDGMLMARGIDYVLDHANKMIHFAEDTKQDITVDGVVTRVDVKGQVPQPTSVIRVSYKYELEK